MLAALSHTGNVTISAQASGIARKTHYEWLHTDKRYKAACNDAMEEAGDLLEYEARRRATTGIDQPVYHGGEVVGQVRRPSDTLLIFLLKGARPERYRERYEHSGPAGGPIPIEVRTAELRERATKLRPPRRRLKP